MGLIKYLITYFFEYIKALESHYSEQLLLTVAKCCEKHHNSVLLNYENQGREKLSNNQKKIITPQK